MVDDAAAFRPLLRRTDMRAHVIETHRLCKSYGSVMALADVDIRIPPGTIGLLGPNGAGKTTFIKCLLNLEPPTSGAATVLGCSIEAGNRASREKVGYSPEVDCHIRGMAGCEYVTYCGQLSGMSFRAARQRAHEVLDLVDMGQERYRTVDTYSTGMKQRVKLAQALVHDPELVFLDEPTNGLDPAGREQVLRVIGSLRRELGTSVVISSHLLHDVDRICDRIVIIAQGRIVQHDSMEALKRSTRRMVEIAPAAAPERFAAALEGAGLRTERLSNGRLRVETEAENLQWLLVLMREQHLPPAEILSSPDALHALFVRSLAAASDGNGS